MDANTIETTIDELRELMTTDTLKATVAELRELKRRESELMGKMHDIVTLDVKKGENFWLTRRLYSSREKAEAMAKTVPRPSGLEGAAGQLCDIGQLEFGHINRMICSSHEKLEIDNMAPFKLYKAIHFFNENKRLVSRSIMTDDMDLVGIAEKVKQKLAKRKSPVTIETSTTELEEPSPYVSEEEILAFTESV